MRTRTDVLPIYAQAVSGGSPGGERQPIDTHQQDDGDVEQEGAHAVDEEGEETNAVDLSHGDLGDLPGEGNDQVDGGTDRGEVVQGHEGVHLEVGRAQQPLDHGQAKGLEDDATDLIENADQHEFDLSDGGEDDTKDDDADVQEHLEVGLGETEAPTCQEGGNGGRGL